MSEATWLPSVLAHVRSSNRSATRSWYSPDGFRERKSRKTAGSRLITASKSDPGPRSCILKRGGGQESSAPIAGFCRLSGSVKAASSVRMGGGFSADRHLARTRSRRALRAGLISLVAVRINDRLEQRTRAALEGHRSRPRPFAKYQLVDPWLQVCPFESPVSKSAKRTAIQLD